MIYRVFVVVQVLIFTVSSVITGQSLFQDAATLTQLLSQDYRVLLDLSGATSSKIYQDTLQEILISDIKELSLGRSYQIRDLKSDDTLKIRYSTDTISLSAEYAIQVINYPSKIDFYKIDSIDHIANKALSHAVLVTNATKDPLSLGWVYFYSSVSPANAQWRLKTYFENDTMSLKKGSYKFVLNDSLKLMCGDKSILLDSGHQLEIDSEGVTILKRHSVPFLRHRKKQYLNILKILAAQTHLDPKVHSQPKFDIAELHEKYLNNQILHEAVDPVFYYHNPVYINDLQDFIYDTIDQHISTFINTNYGWQHILYGDSILRSKDKVSYQEIIDTYRKPVPTSTDKLENLSAKIRSTEGSIFDARNITAALSDFIVERAQEELNITFFENFKKKLDDSPELSTLFSGTKEILQHFEMSNYRSFLEYAKEGFLTDLRALHLNFPKLLKLPKYKQFRDSPEIFNLYIIYNIAELVYENRSISEIMLSTYSQLNIRLEELSKNINSDLAKHNAEDARHKGTTLKELVSLYCDSLKSKFELIHNTLPAKINQTKTQIFKNLKLHLDKNGIPLESMTNLQKNIRRKNRFLISKINDADSRLTGQFLSPMDSVNIYDYYKNAISQNLSGTPFYDYILSLQDIDEYDNYFGTEASQQQLIASGIELTRRFVDRRYSQIIDEFLNQKLLDIQLQKSAYSEVLSALSKNEVKYANAQEQIKQRELHNTLLTQGVEKEIQYWSDSIAISEFDKNSLLFLSKTLHAALRKNSLPPYVFSETQSTISSPELEKIKNKIRETITKLNNKYAATTSNRQHLQTSYADFYFDKVDSIVRGGTFLGEWSKNIFATLDSLENDIEVQKVELTKVTNFESDIANHLNYLDSSYSEKYWKAIQNSEQLKKAFEITIHILKSIQYTDEKGDLQYVSKKEINNILSDKHKRASFLGLLYQRLVNTGAIPTIQQNALESLLLKVSNLSSGLKSDSGPSYPLLLKSDHNKNGKEFYQLISFSIDLINTILTTKIAGDSSSIITQYPLLAKVPDLSEEALSLFENSFNGNYGASIFNATKLFNLITNEELSKEEQKSHNRVNGALLSYGQFMWQVVNAKKITDIKNAINLIAVPPGSSRLKREARFNLSINSYLGASFMHENIKAAPVANSGLLPNSIALSVPIGITGSVGFSDKSSLSISIPVVDIGAVTSFRFGNSTESLPEFELKNLVAPGVFLLYNIRKSPFTVGLGIQDGPQIRRLTNNGNLEEKSAWRFGILAAIDVPIFNLYSGNRTILVK